MTSKPRMAIVGCGRMGQERAKWLPAAGAQITTCVDADLQRAQTLSTDYPGAVALEAVEDIDWDRVDGVFICTPPDRRVEIVRAAGDNGTAVFIEKPLAIDALAAEEVAEIVERQNVPSAVGYMNRYRDSVIRARRFVSESGEIVAVVAYWASRRYAAPWWSDARISGGPFNEQGTHLVDLCRYFGGEISDVRVVASPSQESISIAFRFSDRGLGTLLYTCEAPEKWIGLQAITTGGIVEVKGWDFRLVTNTSNGDVSASDENPFGIEVRAFVNAVATGDCSGIRCDVREAVRTQRSIDRIRAELNLAATAALRA